MGPPTWSGCIPAPRIRRRWCGPPFDFLLTREPRESILRRFDLPVIGRYFPDWEAEVASRLSAD